jgi:NAD dependent epimerase/dehydratase
VTGAAGFIGSHLVEELVSAGAQVTALVHYNARSDFGHLRLLDPRVLGQVQVVSGDVRDPFLVRTVVRGKSVIFHLAALIGIPYSYVAPQSYVDTNVIGTLNVLQACAAEEVERLVHTSSSEVYGTARYVPIDEEHPLQGQSPYSATKISADKLVESFYLSYGTPVVTVRPFNTYGPRQSARAIIPAILSQIAAGHDTLRLGSLEPVRDFTYVKDTVRGFLAIAESTEAVGQVTNIGSGEGISIRGLVDACCEVADRRVAVVLDEPRVRPEKSEVMQLVCDNRKAARARWAPEFTLKEGLAETLRFIQSHAFLYDATRHAT